MGWLDRTKPDVRRRRIAPVVGLVCLMLTTASHGPPLFWAPPAAGKDPPPGGLKAEVSIATDQQMDFGQLADKDGSVVLGLSDAITSDPDFIHYGGSPYSGIYTISGDPSTAVDVSVSATAANGLSLSSFISSEGALPLVGVSLDAAGELVLTVGATLTVDEANASVGGGQSVSFTITSTYN
jgi:hypothetical protein